MNATSATTSLHDSARMPGGMRGRRIGLGGTVALSVAALCLGLLAFAAPALAAPGWLAPGNLSDAGQNASAPQVAMDPTGEAVAVWIRSNGTNTIVQAAGKPTGSESWSTPDNLSAAGQNATVPQVAIDSSGNAIAIWLRSNGTNAIVQAATRPAGGSWSTPEDLSAAGQNASTPQVAIDPAGDVIAVWSRSNGTNTIVQAASRPAGGSWSSPTDLSEVSQNAAQPQVAVNQSGDVVAVWERSNGANTIIQAASRPTGGSWSAPVNLSEAGQNANAPQVAIDPAGDAVAVWNRASGANTIIQASSALAGGSWSTPIDVSEAGPSTGASRVALDSNGDAVAVWRRSNGANTIIQAASRPTGGSWSAPVNLSEAGQNANQPRVAIDPDGDAVAIWSRALSMPVQAARLAAGSWSTPQESRKRVRPRPSSRSTRAVTPSSSGNAATASTPSPRRWASPPARTCSRSRFPPPGRSGKRCPFPPPGGMPGPRWARSNGASVTAPAPKVVSSVTPTGPQAPTR